MYLLTAVFRVTFCKLKVAQALKAENFVLYHYQTSITCKITCVASVSMGFRSEELPHKKWSK